MTDSTTNKPMTVLSDAEIDLVTGGSNRHGGTADAYTSSGQYPVTADNALSSGSHSGGGNNASHYL